MTDQPHGPSLRAAGLAALVTGGAAGIGAAVVRLLHQEGARVHVADVDQDAAGPWQRSWATTPPSSRST